ncbi:MAG: hypothetical protein ABIP39_15575, partial [Polyangiaceae bacterium]
MSKAFRFGGTIAVEGLSPAFFDRLARRVARGELLPDAPREHNHYKVVDVAPEPDAEGYRAPPNQRFGELRIEAADELTATSSALSEIRLWQIDARTLRYEVDSSRWIRPFPRLALAAIGGYAVLALLASFFQGPRAGLFMAGLMLLFSAVASFASISVERAACRMKLEKLVREQLGTVEDDDGSAEQAESVLAVIDA